MCTCMCVLYFTCGRERARKKAYTRNKRVAGYTRTDGDKTADRKF